VSFVQTLPDLSEYRRELIAGGAPASPPLVPFQPGGLLAKLPPPPPGKHGWPWDVESPPPHKQTQWPVISIVTPSYQQGIYLEETIRSVLLQNYPRLEYIVIDGGSTDESAAIIDRYRPWLSFARIGRDRGQSHAINLGFSLASGELRGWLNSDDYYLPHAFTQVAAAAARGADFIYGDSLEYDQTSAQLRHVLAGYARARYAAFPGLIPSHGAFWSRSRHQPVWEEQHCTMDYELWIRLLPGARVQHVNRPLGVLRSHPETKSAHSAHAHRWAEDAERNGRAHPHLYSYPRWRYYEFRLVQRLVLLLRGRGERPRLKKLQQSCAWADPILGAR
jgi:glycosyltransferase involved in cell wall biosynthesis